MECKDFLTSGTNTLFGLVTTPVLRHVCYPFRATRNVRRLRDSLKRLNDCRNDIKERIQLAEESGGLKKPTSRAKGWLERAQATANEAEAVARDYDSRSCVLVGGCSFDCWSNYRIGRRADKAIQQVAELLSQEPSLEAVTTDAPLPPVQERPADSTVPGLEKNLGEAMCFLQEKEEGMLGIWGMGGVGKTTLLTKINNSLNGDSHFDHVLWVVASKDCTIVKLQERILKKLGLPEGRDATSSIFNFLKNKKFVLLIDDVWNVLDLKEVGIPHPLGSMNQVKRKIVLTTRSEDVCGMMGAHSRIRVERLPREHAWSLFREMVGEKTLGSHPGILKLAERVAEECGGLPLALIVVGRSMSTKTSLQDWDNAIKLIQSSKHLPGTEIYLFHRLKLSYDNLEYDTDRECFLICSLWPEDYQISETDLIDCWMGMDIIEDYVSGNSIITRLKAVCLLEANERSYYYSIQSRFGYRDAVKMHDVIRDMALWIVSERGYKWMVLHAGPADRRRWSESHIISLSHGRFDDDVSFEFPICPNLTTLMLSENPTLGYSNSHILREFLNVNNLYSLTYLDLSRTSLHEVPKGICGLVELGYLNMSGNFIRSLPEELKDLNKLKHLILRHNVIHMIPRGLLTRLKKLEVLDLYTFHSDASPILDQLDLAESHLRAFGINVYTISELNRLSKLSGLPTQSLGVCRLEGFVNSIRLSSPETIGKHIQWTLNDLHIMDAGIQEILIESTTDHHHVVSLKTLLYLELRDLVNLEVIIWKRVAPKDFFPRLGMVDIMYCGKLKHVSWILHLPFLECLYLGKCKNLEQVIELEEIEDNDQQDGASFPSLKFLHLSGLDRLARICDPAVDFPSLERVGIYECSQLKQLPFQLIPTCNHKKLLEIEGDREWWDCLEWEDDSIRSSLLPKFKQFDWTTSFSTF